MIWRTSPPGQREADTGSTRRELLAAGFALLLVPACRKESKLPAACTDTAGLTPAEAQVRVALAYADRSPDPARTCSSCMQWVAPREEGACGACSLLKGPIHPLGSCKAFAKRS